MLRVWEHNTASSVLVIKVAFLVHRDSGGTGVCVYANNACSSVPGKIRLKQVMDNKTVHITPPIYSDGF